jgi:hypothetical protein
MGPHLRSLNENIPVKIFDSTGDASLAAIGLKQADFHDNELKGAIIQSVDVCACSGRRRCYLVGAGRRTVIDSEVGRHPDFLGKVLRSLNTENDWNKEPTKKITR